MKDPTRRLLLGIIFVSAFALSSRYLWTLVQTAEGQTVPSATISSDVLFDHDGKDANGGPEQLATAELALTSVTVADLNVSGAIVKSVIVPNATATTKLITGTNGIALRPLLTGLQPGSWLTWLRVGDANANLTRWVKGPVFSYDGVAPSLPTKITITLTTTVTVSP